MDLASILLSSHDAPVMEWSANPEENRKSLGAALLAGNAIISFDNCDVPLSGTLLCQAVTQHRVQVRILGQSLQIEAPVSALLTATGNNLEIHNDVADRSLLCRLDAGVARPGLRKFDFNLKTRFRERRGELVTAGLTVIRAGRIANQKPFGLHPVGSSSGRCGCAIRCLGLIAPIPASLWTNCTRTIPCRRRMPRL